MDLKEEKFYLPFNKDLEISSLADLLLNFY